MAQLIRICVLLTTKYLKSFSLRGFLAGLKLLLRSHWGFHTSAYNCCNAGGAQTTSIFSTGEDGKSLHAMAKLYDTVDRFSSRFDLESLSECDSKIINHDRPEAINSAKSATQQILVEEDKLFTTLCHKMLAGKDGMGISKFPLE